ncbi:hypothetical protein G9P44_004159 [Scheffersomyces stipitis]|nr:hypothetical protein G9P44_004159 [Scheffersomyces stipitis]
MVGMTSAKLPFSPVSNSDTTVVVGTGLAGLTTALQLLERGHKVVLLEKTAKLGGNSIKASSGINGVPTVFQGSDSNDSIASFVEDTLASGKGLCNEDLVHLLASNSKDAIHWLTSEDHMNVDLSSVSRLGGHSHARTHRGNSKLPPGFAIISALSKKLDAHNSLLTLIKNARLDKIVLDNKFHVGSIEYIDESNVRTSLKADNFVLATGGISADFDESSNSLLKKYRPDLLSFPSTNGQQTTGDGQKIAERDVDAKLIHMDHIQVHPTGFVKLDSVSDKWKFLCGEVIRGIGGILLCPSTGNRFTNELSTRDVVTNAIIDNCKVPKTNKLGIKPEQAVSVVVVNGEDYLKAKDHINFYVSQNLLRKGTVADLLMLLKELNPDLHLSVDNIVAYFEDYNGKIISNNDPLGRAHFGSNFDLGDDLYFGLTTPVLHFSMGGIEINTDGQVTTKDNSVVDNLYAAGEVSGGVHGGNRLGGSSLLECVVFGKVISDSIHKRST